MFRIVGSVMQRGWIILLLKISFVAVILNYKKERRRECCNLRAIFTGKRTITKQSKARCKMSDNGRTSRGKLEANEFSGIGIQIELTSSNSKDFVVVTELRNKTASVIIVKF